MLTVTDLFCGAGGSSQGAHAVPGVSVALAANHWELAVATHAENFPEVAHDIANISQADPRRYRRSDILWASPECTNHSVAKGRKRSADTQPDLFGEVLPDEAAVRSRSTMWDVPRFAEHHRYAAIIVENVVDAARWVMWPAWLQAMQLLGYSHRTVWLNSMHAPAQAAPRAPQSRDRLYVVFWRAGNPAPDLDIRPPAWCAPCGREVAAAQWWKRPDQRWGRYRAQYLYRCPSCHAVVEPHALPAAAAIDWAIPGQRIGDRARPLKPATLARIEAGLRRHAHPRPGALLCPAGGTWRGDATPTTAPMGALTTRDADALVVPVEARGGTTRRVRTAGEPLRTQTARLEDALVVPPDAAGAFIAELRGGGCRDTARPVTVPLSTLTAAGLHHMLVRHNTPRGDAGQMCTPVAEPARTITTAGHQSLVGWADLPMSVPAVDDCTFRMLTPGEIQTAMAFTSVYRVLGNRRERVRQLGNAVTPPAAEWLLRAVAASLHGTEHVAGRVTGEASGVAA